MTYKVSLRSISSVYKVYMCIFIHFKRFDNFFLFIFYLFGVLRRFQHRTGHITTGSWKGRGNQYIQLVKVLYCKLPTNGKQLPAFPLEAMPGTEPRPQRWEARVLPLYHRGPLTISTCILVLTFSSDKLQVYLQVYGPKCYRL